jgi:DNA polymerase
MEEMLLELEQKCAVCAACELHTGRTKSVFGVGNPRSPLMFVGEGPGEQEDLKGQPFVGRAGQLLDKFLNAIELDRTGCYIANIVKCRPPKNRDPLPEEQEQCIAFLREQFRLIRPKMVVCLGRIAAQRLISPDFKVTLRHGEWILRGESLFMGTFHPASLLRNPRQKPDAFADFIKIREKLRELTVNS